VISPPTQPVWYSLLVVFATSLLVAAGSVVVAVQLANKNAREAERKWCAIVTTLDTAYSSRPATSPLGRQIAAAMAKLRRDLGC
jgi:hypothetical protein